DLITNVVDAGINDWGGISPVTIDFVNPEALWPHTDRLADRMRALGRTLVQRLPMYSSYVRDRDVWIDKSLHARVLAASDSEYMGRDSVWFVGENKRPPQQSIGQPAVARQPNLHRLLSVASSG